MFRLYFGNGFVMDVFLISLNGIELFVSYHYISGQNIRSVPERLAQAVELCLGVGEIGDAFCVNEKVAVNNFDYCHFHNSNLLMNLLYSKHLRVIHAVRLCLW